MVGLQQAASGGVEALLVDGAVGAPLEHRRMRARPRMQAGVDMALASPPPVVRGPELSSSNNPPLPPPRRHWEWLDQLT